MSTIDDYVFDLGVAYKEDTDRVVKVILHVGEDLKSDETYGPLIIEPLEIFGVDKFDDSAVIIKGRIKTKPLQQWSVGREFLRRVKHAFDAQGIEIPFPHRTVYFGEADPGRAGFAGTDIAKASPPGVGGQGLGDKGQSRDVGKIQTRGCG